jgi:hypothetical protein
VPAIAWEARAGRLERPWGSGPTRRLADRTRPIMTMGLELRPVFAPAKAAAACVWLCNTHLRNPARKDNPSRQFNR